jgi:hypothetical protein
MLLLILNAIKSWMDIMRILEFRDEGVQGVVGYVRKRDDLRWKSDKLRLNWKKWKLIFARFEKIRPSVSKNFKKLTNYKISKFNTFKFQNSANLNQNFQKLSKFE